MEDGEQLDSMATGHRCSRGAQLCIDSDTQPPRSLVIKSGAAWLRAGGDAARHPSPGGAAQPPQRELPLESGQRTEVAERATAESGLQAPEPAIDEGELLAGSTATKGARGDAWPKATPPQRATTAAMAARLAQLTQLRLDPMDGVWRRHNWLKIALKIARCATERDFRCGHQLCPRCSVKRAKKKKRLLKKVAKCATGELWSITLTRYSDEARDGVRELLKDVAKLRRRRGVLEISGGFQKIEVVPAKHGVYRWNCHIHMLVELMPGTLDVARLKEGWADVLGDAVGDCDARLANLVHHPTKKKANREPAKSTLCQYLTKETRRRMLKWSDDDLLDWTTELRGLRTMSYLGTWREKARSIRSQKRAKNPSAAQHWAVFIAEPAPTDPVAAPRPFTTLARPRNRRSLERSEVAAPLVPLRSLGGKAVRSQPSQELLRPRRTPPR